MAPQTPPADDPVPQLVGQVFETAPAAERRRLLAYLIKPLSLLSLVAVANGMFARYRLGPAWASVDARQDELQRVGASDIAVLVSHVQQVRAHAVDGLAQVQSQSPVLAGSATAALLITLLAQRARERPPLSGNDFDA